MIRGNTRPYRDMTVKALSLPDSPGHRVQLACEITQRASLTGDNVDPKLLLYLLKAGHTSVFEHLSTTWFIRDVSRSFLAQITRHRMASYTCGSQHYQDYRDYSHIVSDELHNFKGSETFAIINGMYTELIAQGVPPEEARQILPNAKAVNILWTINVRSLINFLNQRLCERNVEEMTTFASYVYIKCLDWWPELFQVVGPQCRMPGECRQGRMKAERCRLFGSPWTQPICGLPQHLREDQLA
jgi:thymidylate synthase (FAD)